jgi:hypothetical protein
VPFDVSPENATKQAPAFHLPKFCMDQDINGELRTAQARRAYWKAEYEAALASGDDEQAANALEYLRKYDSLIESLEALRK